MHGKTITYNTNRFNPVIDAKNINYLQDHYEPENPDDVTDDIDR